SMKQGWIGTGPKVKLFTEMFKAIVGCKHAIPVGSCTAGLFLSLKAMGVRPGDEVITTPLTFASTVNVIEHLGAKPVFVDVERSTGLIDLKAVKEAFTDKTRAVVPVHLYGRPVNVLYLHDMAAKHGVAVVEDAAHAVEASSGPIKIGNGKLPTCFSFYVTKNVTTCEGGMVTCGDDEVAAHIAILSNHGLDKDAWKRYSDDGFKHYQVVEPGYKFNMTDMQAAIGIHQLTHLWEWHERRVELWKRYMSGLADTSLELPIEGEYEDVHALHLFTVLVDEENCGIGRDALASRLHSNGIGTGVHYVPIHLQPYYREKYGYTEGDFPKSEYIGGKTLSLPLSSSRTITDVDRVVEVIKEMLP
ncbi:MAG: DegT/DnrJ/EryC1/StrS family aminotransferase, partial [Gammaproteobacteria bacterium]|nr:DegT/DnrJ/EryC1/StrS family aminotransferase [Gammaproteobacteria bacterium]